MPRWKKKGLTEAQELHRKKRILLRPHKLNMDEMGLQLGGGRIWGNSVLSVLLRGKSVYRAKSNKLELVTLFECFTANGNYLPSLFIFSGKRFMKNWLEGLTEAQKNGILTKCSEIPDDQLHRVHPVAASTIPATANPFFVFSGTSGCEEIDAASTAKATKSEKISTSTPDAKKKQDIEDMTVPVTAKPDRTCKERVGLAATEAVRTDKPRVGFKAFLTSRRSLVRIGDGGQSSVAIEVDALTTFQKFRTSDSRESKTAMDEMVPSFRTRVRLEKV
ncbi:hypothetical protein BT69DRAFT_1292566 [Atractiella rhizophila]|nr:hypothetical protein BT69DRAFT_1292566 [Atractiella rhizophila]